MEDRVKALEKERDEGFALRDQWLKDSREQTAQAWATRNKELDELWPKVHNLEAEVSQLKEHTEQLMRQLADAEARVLKAETLNPTPDALLWPAGRELT